MRHHLVLGPKALAAREPPGHCADFVERGVHLCDPRVGEVSVGHGQLKACSNLLGRAACAGKSGFGGSRIVSVCFGDVENDTVHGSVDLIEERTVSPPNNGKNFPESRCGPKRPLLNDECHE